MEASEGDQSLKPTPKTPFKKRLYRFLTGKDGSQAMANPPAEPSEATSGEVHSGDKDGQASAKSNQSQPSASSAYITVAAKNVPSNVLSGKDRNSMSPEALLRFKVGVHPALHDQLSANEASASTTLLENAMSDDTPNPLFEAPSDAPRPNSSVYSLSGESPSPVSSSSLRDQVSDGSGGRRSDEQGAKDQGVGPFLPELEFSLSMDDFFEFLGLVDESKLVLVEQTNQTVMDESAASSRSVLWKTKGGTSLERKGLESAGDASSQEIQGNQTRQLGRIHSKSPGKSDTVKSRLFATSNPEEDIKSWSAPSSAFPLYNGQIPEHTLSSSSMEAVKDSDSSGNLSLEDESHPGPEYGSTGGGRESSAAASSSNKFPGHGLGRLASEKPAEAVLTTRKPKGYLPEASKENTGTAHTAASGPAGDIASGIAESKVQNPGTCPEASRTGSSPAPLTLEQWQEHYRSLKQRSSAQSPSSHKTPVHSPCLEQHSGPSISPRTPFSLRSPSPATYSAFPSPSTDTFSPTSLKARLDTPLTSTELPPVTPTPCSSSATPPRTPISAGLEAVISSKPRQVSLPTSTSARQPTQTKPLAPAPTASKVVAKRRFFEQLPTIEERSPIKEAKEANQGNYSLAFPSTPPSSFAPSFISDPTIRPPSRSGSPNTHPSTLETNLLQGTVPRPRDHQPAAQLGVKLPQCPSVKAATHSLNIIASCRDQQNAAPGNQDCRPGRRRRFTPTSLSTVTEELNSELQECATTYGVEAELTRQGQSAQQIRSFSHGAASGEQSISQTTHMPEYSSLQHRDTSSANEVPPTIPALRSTKSSGDLPHSVTTRSSALSPSHIEAAFTRTPRAFVRSGRSAALAGSHTCANTPPPSQYSSSPKVRSFSQEGHPKTPHPHITDEMGQYLSKCCGERDEEEHVLPAVNDRPATPAAPQGPTSSPSRSPPGSPPKSAPIPIPSRSRARDNGLLLTPTTGHASKDRDREQHMRAGLRPSTGEGTRQGGEFLAREGNSYNSSFADDELRGRGARSREPIYLPLPPTQPPPPPPCPAETTEAEFDDSTMASIVPGEVIASSTPRRTRAVNPESASKLSSKGSDKSRKTRRSVRSTKTAKSAKSAAASARSRGPSPPAAGHGMLATAWFYEATPETEEDRAARLAEQEAARRAYREKARARKELKLQNKASDRALRDARKEAKAAEGGPALGADYAAAWELLRGALPFGKTKGAASEAK